MTSTSFEKILLFLLQAQLNVRSTDGAPIKHAANAAALSRTLNTARSTQQCGFDGNPDFYGLGIRIAIYLQWATALIANHVLDEDSVKGYLETNSVFLVAVFVALAIATAGKNVRSAEIVVCELQTRPSLQRQRRATPSPPPHGGWLWYNISEKLEGKCLASSQFGEQEMPVLPCQF
jgi:hypothetical protein